MFYHIDGYDGEFEASTENSRPWLTATQNIWSLNHENKSHGYTNKNEKLLQSSCTKE